MKNYFLFVLSIFVLMFGSCSKKGSVKPSPTHTDSIIVKNNVIVIDSSKLTLVSTSDQLNQGIYVFTSTGSFPNFVDSCVIVGSTGDGYLRKITSVTKQGSTIILTTEQGCFEDVFQQGTFALNSVLSGMHRSSSPKITDGYDFEFNLGNPILYQNGPITITLPGSISFMPQWVDTLSFSGASLDYFSSNLSGTFNANLGLVISASGSYSFSQTDTLKKLTTRNTVFIGGVPVVLATDFYLIFDIGGSISGSYSRTFNKNFNCAFNLGVQYSGGAWQSTHSFTPTTTFTIHDTGGVSVTLTCSGRPQMNIRVYGVAGPYAALPLKEFVAGNLSLPSLNWDFTVGEYLQPTLGVSAAIFGRKIFDYNTSWISDTLKYQTPFQITKISGDNQTGPSGQVLPLPIKVQVLDNMNLPQSYVPVYFTVSLGCGSVQKTQTGIGSQSTDTIFTDANGLAQTYWTPGSNSTQSLFATAKMANGTQISGVPITFTANNSNSGPTFRLSKIINNTTGDSSFGKAIAAISYNGNQITQIVTTSRSGTFGLLTPPFIETDVLYYNTSGQLTGSSISYQSDTSGGISTTPFGYGVVSTSVIYNDSDISEIKCYQEGNVLFEDLIFTYSNHILTNIKDLVNTYENEDFLADCNGNFVHEGSCICTFDTSKSIASTVPYWHYFFAGQYFNSPGVVNGIFSLFPSHNNAVIKCQNLSAPSQTLYTYQYNANGYPAVVNLNGQYSYIMQYQ